MYVFHYHLVSSRVRQIEERYLGKLGFRLVGRYGRVDDEAVSFEAGMAWEDLDQAGFKLRLTEVERGAVNVVVQPGQWPVPRVDHVGLALDDDEFAATLERAAARNLRVQEHGGRRTFVATGVGYRLELHPPRDWLEELLDEFGAFHVGELQLRVDDPEGKAEILADVLGLAPTEIGRLHDDGVVAGPVPAPA